MKGVKFLVFAATLFLNTALFAQADTSEPLPASEQVQKAPGDRDTRIEEKRAELIADLQLTEEQIPTFDAINEKYRQQFDEARADQSQADRRAMMQSLREIREARKAELKELLTPEQFEILEAKQKELREQRPQRRPGRRG